MDHLDRSQNWSAGFNLTRLQFHIRHCIDDHLARHYYGAACHHGYYRPLWRCRDGNSRVSWIANGKCNRPW